MSNCEKRTILLNGHLLCQATSLDGVGTIWLKDGIITKIEMGYRECNEATAEIIDCQGKYIFPGLVDISCFCGELGMSHREDVASLTKAAIQGGYSDIVLGPWGSPMVENAAVITDLKARTAGEPIRYHLLGSLTKGREDAALTEMGLMKKAGAIGFSDGAKPIRSSVVLRNALQYAERLGLPVVLFPGDADLDQEGVMHEGEVSTQIGLPGITVASEKIGVSRAAALAEITAAKICIAPVSIGHQLGTVETIQTAVPARSLLLSDTDIKESGYDPNFHIYPPLREASQDVIQAVVRGDITMIFSDHKPLTRVEKDKEFCLAEAGAMGIETALAAAFTALKDIRLVVDKMCFQPANFFGIKKGLHIGQNSDIVVFEPFSQWYPKRPFKSKGINEPLQETLLTGRVISTYFC